MKIETYCKTKEVCLVEEEKDVRSDICQSLGLEAQSKLSDNINVDKYYPVISKESLFILKRFLPKSYSKMAGDWKGYCFDTIPYKVLEETAFADSLRTFSDLQIWTPEQNIVDPMIIGVIGSVDNASYYLISRWGESLKSFEEIKEVVLSRMRERDSIAKEIPNVVKSFMNAFILKGEGYYPEFQGTAYGKSKCCSLEMYIVKHSNKEKYFYICSKCGNLVDKKKNLFQKLIS